VGKWAKPTQSIGIYRPLTAFSTTIATCPIIPSPRPREAPRLIACGNNLKQWGVAMATHHEAKSKLANNVVSDQYDRVTAIMNQAVLEAGGKGDAFLKAAAKQVLQRGEW
jgi:hypothetical protein